MKGKFKLILTADYEVWGNGSGCVENCIIDPSEKMMEVAEKYNSRFTFFLDVCEYWAFDQIEQKGLFNGDYRPASLIRNQLRDSVKRGHDVQLHFHPQWLNYKFLSNQNWTLDARYWRLPSVDDYYSDDWNSDKLIKTGIQTLLDLFKEVKPDYEVFAFRAGAWCMQPEEYILQSLHKHGIVLDSTVAPGRLLDDGLNKFDFTDAPDLPYWQVGDKITTTGQSGIYELPITTVKVNKLMSLLFKMLKVRRIKSLKAKGCFKKVDPHFTKSSEYEEKSITSFKMLNLSDGCSFYEMKYITEKMMQKGHKDSVLPIVAISHPKTFGHIESLDRFLSWACENENIEFSSFSKLKADLV